MVIYLVSFTLSGMRGVIGIHDMRDKNIWRALIAELVGTFVLVFIGCGSIMWPNDPNTVDVTKIALTFGFVIATIAQVRKFLNFFFFCCITFS